MFTPQFIAALVLAGITAAALPYYCVLTYPGKSRTTLIYKMCLSTLFMVTMILVLSASSYCASYLILMFLGFLAAFAGDFFLGRSDKLKDFIIGAGCFAMTHIFYVISLSVMSHLFFPGVHWFNGMEIGIYLTFVCIMLIIFVLRKPPFHKLILIMSIYLCLLTLMVTKAFGVGLRLMDENPAAILLPIGAVCFICSDYTLGMMRFKMHERTKPFKAFSTCTYFIAQMLIALSMFVKIPQ